MVAPKSELKIALFDIETAPALGYFFDLWKEGNIVSVKDDWYILSYSVKWLDKKQVHTKCLIDYPSFKKRKEDDRALVKDLWKIFDTADILIAHNGDRFDVRKANARFVAQGLKPPSPYRTIDTLKIARRHFKFDSNRLDSLGGYLRVGRKLPNTGAHLWLGCMAGNPKSWRVMRKYNARDVLLLERVYLKIRAWASNHPDLDLIENKGACPVCRSLNITAQGVRYTKTQKYRQFRCSDCGSWHKGKGVKR